MMRTSIVSFLLVFFLLSTAYAQKVKVLVLDDKFTQIPAKGEELKMLDKLSGDLYMGFSDYRGVIEVWRGKNGLYLINELPLEDYVEGVVKAETADDWADEALKAQAVIVRTYVLKQMMSKRDERYHVTSTVLHQVYKGLNSDSAVTEAVRATKGQVLTYDGKPIMAFYHSTSGGRTEAAEEVFGQSFPYLKSVEANGRLSPLSVWARRIPIQDIEEATGIKNLRDIKIVSHTSTGRVKKLLLIANPEEVTMNAADFRKMLGWRRLPSTSFTIKVEGGHANIEGSGYGHGVGLCQWTALEMAREGMKYNDILSFFYPEATLTNDTFGF